MRDTQKKVQIAGGLLAAVGLAGVLTLTWMMWPSSRALGKESSLHKTMISFELAYTSERAERILDDWKAGKSPAATGGTLLADARENLRLDAWLIPFYVALLTGLCLVLSGTHGRWPGNPWLLFAFLPVVAGALDYRENSLLARQIDQAEAGEVVWPLLVARAGAAASLKFLLLGLVTLALLVVGIVILRATMAGAFRKLPQPAWVPFEDVVAAEQAYLAGRRREMALGKDDVATARPIGLAFSGGGIRSATVCLGALRSLCRAKALPWVDYLSTVSGGGYIGSALSSLLSINRRTATASSLGLDDQYLFEPGDSALLTTREDRFPFEPNRNLQEELRKELGGRFDGRVQLEHLRTHGDFLIRTKRLFHRDVLRTVGTVLGGLFYHLLMGFVVMAVVGAGYLVSIFLMTGPLPGGRIENLLGDPSFAKYCALLFDFGGSMKPALVAAVLGFLALPSAMMLCSLIWFLPERWFRRPGDTVEENREYHSLWALFTITLIVAAALTWFFVARDEERRLAYLTLPMFVYAGGWLASLLLHWFIAVWPRPAFNRNQRSRFAAWKGTFNYLTAVSVALLLVPFALAWINRDASSSSVFEHWPVKESMAWLASLLGSGWLAKSAFGKAASGLGGGGGGGPLAALKRLPGTVRNFVLGLFVTVLVVLGLLLVTALLLRWELVAAADTPLAFRLCLLGGLLLAFVALGYVIDFNKLSLHFFYRDRLVEAYLQTEGQVPTKASSTEVPGSLDLLRDNAEMRLVHLHGVREDPPSADQKTRGRGGPAPRPPAPASGQAEATALPRDLRLGERAIQALPFAPAARKAEELAPVEAVTGAPLHLVVTCLNLTRSRDMTRRSRKADAFVFSKLFCGSDTTGYVNTRSYRGGETKLARTMTVSGAAANSAMGSRTFFAQALAMTLFNVRLGQWIENPRYRNGARAHRREGWVFWPAYLWQELRGASDASHRLVHLSDGAHTGDNLGLYPLLRRRCRLIVACDAESDAEISFGSFTEVVRQVDIDLGIEIDIKLGAIRPDRLTGLSVRPFALGRIAYPQDKECKLPAEKGWLLLVKSCLSGAESEKVLNYKRRNPTFPHQTTADQFFDDAQFESYRELGELMMDRALGKDLSELLRGKPEWFKDWRRELGDVLPPR